MTGRRRFILLAQKLALSLASLVLTLAVLELWAYLKVESDGNGHALSAKRWYARHWGDENSLKYRDREHVKGDKPVMFVLGDSFAAGYGVERHERFSSLMQEALPQWDVFNVAVCGWSTLAESKALREHPVKPDCVVLSYVTNDIDGAYRKLRKDNLANYVPLSKKERQWSECSHLVNLVYWKLKNIREREKWKRALEHTHRAYDDPEVWGAQAAELDSIARFCDERAVPMLAVVWPQLTAREETRHFTQKVCQHLQGRGVFCADIFDDLQALPQSEIVVNSHDAHPSPRAHRIAAEALLDQLQHVPRF